MAEKLVEGFTIRAKGNKFLTRNMQWRYRSQKTAFVHSPEIARRVTHMGIIDGHKAVKITPAYFDGDYTVVETPPAPKPAKARRPTPVW